MRFRLAPTLAVTLDLGDGAVNGGERRVDLAGLRFRFSERGRETGHVKADTPFAACFDCGAHVCQADLMADGLHTPPRSVEGAVGREHWKFMRARQLDESFTLLPRRRAIPAHYFQ
jgi:hypothetical protein